MKNKKIIILSIVAIAMLFILIVGATFAYFQASGGTGSSANLNVTTYTSDLLTFEIGKDISIYADATTFAEGKGNASGDTYAKTQLTPNNKTNEATKYYYLYLKIENNNFEYTINNDTPELLLTVTDASGNPVTEINGLTYKTVADGKGASISGFDITTSSDLITIFNNKEITATNKTEVQRYDIKVTFVNYNEDQSKNMKKGFQAKLLLQKKEITLPICDENTLLKDCIISQYTGTQGENNLYHHDGTLENGIDDGSYRYAGGGYELTDAGKKLGVTRIFSKSQTDDSALIDCYCGDTKTNYVTDCESSLKYYLLKNDSEKYTRYNDVINKAKNDGLIKDDLVNNFVCFGSDLEDCPYDNLYRIIGVFDNKVKLIKADYANSNLLGTNGEYVLDVPLRSLVGYRGKMPSVSWLKWNSVTETNTWSESNLNKINLNTNYINNIGESWANKIVATTWKVGGNTYANIGYAIPSVVYKNEITNPAAGTTYDAKIGLMYVSDYAYAASPETWENTVEAVNDNLYHNWIYLGGGFEWTITPVAKEEYYENHVFAFWDTGNGVCSWEAKIAMNSPVRPTFYLIDSNKYISGTGTQTDPICIN